MNTEKAHLEFLARWIGDDEVEAEAERKAELQELADELGAKPVSDWGQCFGFWDSAPK